jgi:cell shape-determining protein MreC
MKKILLISIIIVLVVLFGTFPLSIVSKIFQYIGKAIEWLAKILNVFGWNGII